MKLQQQQAKFTYNVAQLIDYIYTNQYTATFGDAYRDPELAELFAKEGKGIKDSLHTSRMAIDLNLFDATGNYIKDRAPYEKFGAYWKSLHTQNRWGGDFIAMGGHIDDANHFQMNIL